MAGLIADGRPYTEIAAGLAVCNRRCLVGRLVARAVGDMVLKRSAPGTLSSSRHGKYTTAVAANPLPRRKLMTYDEGFRGNTNDHARPDAPAPELAEMEPGSRLSGVCHLLHSGFPAGHRRKRGGHRHGGRHRRPGNPG